MLQSKIYENKHLWKRPLYPYLNFWHLSNFLVFLSFSSFNPFNSSRSPSDWDSSFSLPDSVWNSLYLSSSFTYSAPPLFSLKKRFFSSQRSHLSAPEKQLNSTQTCEDPSRLSNHDRVFSSKLYLISRFYFLIWFYFMISRTTTETGTGSDDGGARDRATVFDDRSKSYNF